MNAVSDIRLSTRYLRSSEMFFQDNGDPPVRVMTVLGSCVSVTFFHPRLGAAAMCHAIMPRCPRESECRADRCRQPFKYAHCALGGMIRRFHDLGIPPAEVEAKLFGGSDMFQPDPTGRGIPSVGRMNVQAAREALRAGGIRLRSEDVGGGNGRKVCFFSHTGEVWVKRVQSGFNPTN